MRFSGFTAILLFASLFFLSCASRASSTPESPSNGVVVGEKEMKGALTSPRTKKAAETTAMLPTNSPAPKVPKGRTPAVGGCNFHCIKPDLAVKNFFMALLKEPRPNTKESSNITGTSEEAPPHYFVDSRVFSYKGAKHGQDWNRMWAGGDRKARKKKMEQFFADLRVEILGVTTGVAVADLVNANLKSLASRPGEALYLFAAPGLPEPLQATLRKRGVEWLLHELEVHQ